MTRAKDAEILAELVEAARAHPDRQLLQFGSLLSAHQYRRLYRAFRAGAPEGARVLDWGAGNGHFSYFLQRAEYRAEGFSLLDAPFRAWLPNADYPFARGHEANPVGLPYCNATFDAVASIGVLEHVRETGGSEAASLREIARILRPGGVFVCYHFPNRWSWIDWAARRVPGMHRHDYRYSRGQIVDLVRGAGLALREWGRYGILPRNFGGRLPTPLARSRALARTWDALDSSLALPLSLFCQNYYFVAVKPAALDSSGGRTFRNAK
jgi:SAM-dependent methyltransferase